MEPFEYGAYSRCYNPWCKVLVFEQPFEEKTEFLKLRGCQACSVTGSFKAFPFFLS